MVDRFITEDATVQELEETFNNQAYSDYYVVFLRLLVSAFMQKHAAFYANFIDEGRTINQFCETEVEPMARESDNIHVAALALAVGLPIAIENCQQSGDLNRIEFPAEVDHFSLSEAADEPHSAHNQASGAGEQSQIDNGSTLTASSPPVTLLYRPGHYDILYRK
ncbi:Ubiquitin thioesterase OTUB1 [Fasciola gigantica]|uniref:Ubiquitin thioesterase OTUB1 n=1 Tax=Fasciola gigantica TaxID=46835 RepID=A0A504YEK3_FASGI|nr:Ubiquitin thioesterase OTUB1 [Fasciola gigantica]